MTSQRPPAPFRRAAALALVAAAAPGLAQAKYSDVLYERTVMTEAHARCALFSQPVAAALEAGRVQARRAAVANGEAEAQLRDVERRAREAAWRVDCKSSDLTIAADRVRHAFEGYARLPKMNYPGEVGEWRADRASGTAARWRLSQTTPAGSGEMIFGLAGRRGANALLAIADFPQGAPYAARLLIRDTARTAGPYLDRRGLKAGAILPLTRRMPPETAVASFAAEARSRAAADLAPDTMTAAWAFRFPAEAARALTALDPREAVAVEFLFADPGTAPRRVYLEVGDFALGRAFLQAEAQ